MGTPFITVPVASVQPETPTSVRLAVDISSSELMGQYTTPGQYVRMFVGDQTPNYFSIASPPEDDHRLEFLIRLKGEPATALANASVGDAVSVSEVAGGGFPVGEALGNEVLLFATGSGIAPIRAVIGHLMAQREDYGPVSLFYGVRNQAEIAFADELGGWEAAGVDAHVTLSRPAQGWLGLRGYVQAALEAVRPERLASKAPQPAVFVCGMDEMVSAVTAALEVRGLPPGRIFKNF